MLTLDPAPLAAWRAQTRDIAPHFVRELIDDVLADTAAHLTILERAVRAGDTTACHFVAHRLQSSCNAVGAFQLAFLMEEMELLAKNDAVAFLGSQFVKIQAEYRRVERALEAERAVGHGGAVE